MQLCKCESYFVFQKQTISEVLLAHVNCNELQWCTLLGENSVVNETLIADTWFIEQYNLNSHEHICMCMCVLVTSSYW